MLLMGVGFFFTALLYATAGFGGGSTYISLMTLSHVNFHLLPLIALSCNLLVVTGSSYLHIKNGYLDLKLSAALVVFSIPATWLGSQITLNKNQFLLILGSSLLVSSIILLTEKKTALSERPVFKYNHLLLGPILGVPLGFLSGITGIGGGIFLAPVLHHLKVMPPKVIAAISSFFIIVNSITGLIGQVTKLPHQLLTWSSLSPFFLLPFAVLVGGQIGGRLGVIFLSPLSVKRCMAVLILLIACQILLKVADSYL